MSIKVEKTENKNELKLRLKNLMKQLKKYMHKVQNILIYQDLEKEKHQWT